MKVERILAYPIMLVMLTVLVSAACLASMGADGCAGKQNTTAALIGVAGTAIASLEAVEGNTASAVKIQMDFSAAQTAVLNWKTGTPTQDVAQALQIVLGDLNLLPVSDQDKAYVTLAVGTVNSVLLLFQQQDNPSFVAAARTVMNAPPAPKDADDFKRQWNALPGNLAPLK